MTPEERVYNLSDKLKYMFTEDHLIEEGRGGANHWRRAWPLQQLSPELERATGRPQGTKETLLGSVTVLGLGLSLYFSDFNAKAPLLAPFVLIVGLSLLGRVLKNGRVETWTMIRKWDGSLATSFQHRDCQPGERAAFEDALAEAVRHAHRTRGGDQ
jgi:hypothetical protein